MNWILIGLPVLLLIWMLYQEWRRTNKNWLAARIIACIIAVSAFVLMIVPLHFKTSIITANNQAVLLTQGWNKDSLAKFRSANKNLQIFTTEKTTGAIYCPDLHLLNRPLHIFGDGLNDYELQSLQQPYQFHPSTLQNTIQKIDWNESIQLGYPLNIRGNYINASDSPVKIILSAFSVPLDSTSIGPKQTAAFQLSTVPKQIGRSVFTISVLQEKDTIESNPVPVQVSLSQPLRLLMLSSAPDFEKKFLKNWLAAHNFQFAIKTKLTNGKWEQQFINRSPLSQSAITTALLKEFDIVIGDMNALAALSAAESNALQEAVGRSGIGLLVQADTSSATNSFYSRPFVFSTTHDSLTRKLQLSLSSEAAALPLTAETNLSIRPNETLQTNLHDQQGRILAATALYGAGRIGATTINNSFVWQLSGQAELYDLYWSNLLTGVAPRSDQHTSWRLSRAFPKMNERVDIRFDIDSTSSQLQVAETVLYPGRDQFLKGRWNTSFWPRRQGWMPVLQNGQPAGWFYVYGANDWKGVSRAERSLKSRLGSANLASEKNLEHALIQEKEVNPFYFFLIFLAAAGFLWYEKKRHAI